MVQDGSRWREVLHDVGKRRELSLHTVGLLHGQAPEDGWHTLLKLYHAELLRAPLGAKQ